jgi:ABC-type lipoprotein export system ATPase subunit
LKANEVDMDLSLICENVSFCRRRPDGTERQILRNVNATLNGGQGVLISGRTGAGKSTLLHLMAALLRPSQGQIKANGQAISRWNTAHRDVWRQQVGIVFQHPYLITELTVLENVMLPLIPRGTSIKHQRRTALETLDAVGISHLAEQHVQILSGGEQQRVSIARAIVFRPAILIADEPTAHQDDDGAKLIIEKFSEWKAPQTLTIVAAHDHRWEKPGKFVDIHFHIENACLKEVQ